MSVDTVYQTQSFEIVALNDPELDDVLETWGLPGALDNLPEDSISQLQDDGAFMILNKANGGIGVIDPVTLSLSFNEYHPSEGMEGIRTTVIETLIDKIVLLDELDETEDFYRGMNAVLDVITSVQTTFTGSDDE